MTLIDRAKSLIQLVVHQCRSTNVPHAGFVPRNTRFLGVLSFFQLSKTSLNLEAVKAWPAN